MTIEEEKQRTDRLSRTNDLIRFFERQKEMELAKKEEIKECTFKPEMITKKSNLSKKVIKEVQDEVNDRLNEKYQKNQTNSDFGQLTTKSLGVPTQRNQE